MALSQRHPCAASTPGAGFCRTMQAYAALGAFAMSLNISDTFASQLQQMRTDLIAQLRAQRGGKIGRAEAAPDRHDCLLYTSDAADE